MKYHKSKLLFAQALIPLVVLLSYSISLASIGPYANFKIELKEQVGSNIPIIVSTVFTPWMDFDKGDLVLMLWDSENKTIAQEILWSGEGSQLWNGDGNKPDSIVGEHSFGVLAPGGYRIGISFDFPPVGDITYGLGSKALYLVVREDEIRTSYRSIRSIYHVEINEEIERRGLKGVSSEELKEKAPDLVKRRRALLTARSVAPKPVSKVEESTTPASLLPPSDPVPRYMGRREFRQPNPPQPRSLEKPTPFPGRSRRKHFNEVGTAKRPISTRQPIVLPPMKTRGESDFARSKEGQEFREAIERGLRETEKYEKAKRDSTEKPD